jgi:hypothetical protein
MMHIAPDDCALREPSRSGLIFHGGSKEIDTACRTVSLKNDIGIFDLSEVCSPTCQLPHCVPQSSAQFS